MAMANHNETVISHVVDDGRVKEWVGIGWIDIREATDQDLSTLPILES